MEKEKRIRIDKIKTKDNKIIKQVKDKR